MSSVAIAEELTDRELATLAGMHLACLPDATVSLFGAGYLRSMYAYLAGAETEVLFVARDGDAILGSALVSLARPSLGMRLALKSGLLPHLLARLWRPRVLAALAASMGDAAIQVPELVFIFVAPEARRQGVGTSLLRACDDCLRRRGVAAYGLRADAGPDNPALRVYAAHGFAEVRRFAAAGQDFVWMEKGLPA